MSRLEFRRSTPAVENVYRREPDRRALLVAEIRKSDVVDRWAVTSVFAVLDDEERLQIVEHLDTINGVVSREAMHRMHVEYVYGPYDATNLMVAAEDKSAKRETLVEMYATCLRAFDKGTPIDWKFINRLLIDRMGLKAFERFKNDAWHCVQTPAGMFTKKHLVRWKRGAEEIGRCSDE